MRKIFVIPNTKGFSILLVVTVVSIVLVALAWLIFGSKLETIKQPGQNVGEPQKLEVATDPSFPEVKGKLIPGFPEFPVYPGATLKASAKTNRENQPDTGYRAKWVTKDSVPLVVKWSQQELPKNGWKIEALDDPENTGEQVTQISKGNFKGYIGAEAVAQGTEIVVEVRTD